MKYVFMLEQITIDLEDSYNYAQSFLNNNSSDNFFLNNINIILFIIGLIILYCSLYIPIKLYQIKKNTKLIKEELENINRNICKLNNNDNKKLQFKDYDIEIVNNDNLRQ